MSEERKIDIRDASMYRMQAMVENLLVLQIEILEHLSKKPFKEISDRIWSKINSDTNTLIKLHSNLGGDHADN